MTGTFRVSGSQAFVRTFQDCEVNVGGRALDLRFDYELEGSYLCLRDTLGGDTK